jgi:imidazolonepropionase-like amidohydrolase
MVVEAAQQRFDFIKVHTPMSRDIFLAIAAKAREQGLPVAGHVPQPAVSLTEASNAGLASIEHVDHVRAHISGVLGGPGNAGIEKLTASQAAALSELFALFRRNRTWFCPTLTDSARAVPILSTDWRLRYFGAVERKTWEKTGVVPPERAEQAARGHQAALSLTAAMHKAGVGLLAGSDAAPGGLSVGMTGFWLHEELKQLVVAGLTPMDALRTATYNPAEFFGLLDSLGTVAPGKLAEMVLLDANPLDDISNTTKINMVFTGGRVYRRPALDAILAAVEKNAQQN